MYKYDFSVIVVTYNAIWDKLKLTLDSIIRQSFENFEIVMADDGSKEDVFDKVEAFFAENNFTRYTLVRNEQNQGTIKNLLSGLDKAQGRYIRMFGPGDLFFDENSLAGVYKFNLILQFTNMLVLVLCVVITRMRQELLRQDHILFHLI